MDVQTIVRECLIDGVVLTVVDGEKLSIKGNKKAPAVTALRDLVQRDRGAVLLAVQQAHADSEIWGRRLAMVNAAVAATHPAENMVEHSIAPDILPLPPIRNTTGKPLLPPELWAEGLATFSDAWRIDDDLYGTYATVIGRDAGGFYVRAKGWQWVTITRL